jgi:hypothetical protein
MIVVDTLEKAVELFEGRSGIYSSRYICDYGIIFNADSIRPSVPMMDLINMPNALFSLAPYSMISTALYLHTNDRPSG